jgi:hypothetical protein
MSMGWCGRLARQWATASGWRMQARAATNVPLGTERPMVPIHRLSVSGRSLLPEAA